MGAARSTVESVLASSRHCQLRSTAPVSVSVSLFSFLCSLKRGLLHRLRGLGFCLKAADGAESSPACLALRQQRLTSVCSHCELRFTFGSQDLISLQTVCVEHKHFRIHQGACSCLSLGSHPGSGQAALAAGPCVPVYLKPLGCWFRKVSLALRIGKGWDGEGLLCHFRQATEAQGGIL